MRSVNGNRKNFYADETLAPGKPFISIVHSAKVLNHTLTRVADTMSVAVANSGLMFVDEQNFGDFSGQSWWLHPARSLFSWTLATLVSGAEGRFVLDPRTRRGLFTK